MGDERMWHIALNKTFQLHEHTPFLTKTFQVDMKVAAEPEALSLGPWGRELRQSHIIQPSEA